MNDIGRFCDYRGCLKEHDIAETKQFGEFFVLIYSCWEHHDKLVKYIKDYKTDEGDMR